MEKIPQQVISQMKEGLEKIEMLPEKKLEMLQLLNKIEEKEGMAPKEFEELSKLIDEEEEKIEAEISLTEEKNKATLDFLRKGSQIWKEGVEAIEEKVKNKP